MNTSLFELLSLGTTIRSRLIDVGAKAPVVLFLTGDGPKGTKSLSWTNLPPLFERLGISSFLFDFHGLGESDGNRQNLTLGVGRQNFRDAYAFVRALRPDVPIVVFGSSFGATVALNEPDILSECAGVVFKSPAPCITEAYLNELSDSEAREWFETGFSATNSYDISVLLDSTANRAFENARRLTVPCFTTHGTSDLTVPWTQSAMLQRLWGGDFQLELLPGVSHGYSEDGAWDKMAFLTTSWTAKVLKTNG
jgi:pimeloyl-ACP methyl ester carboxylesterase